MLKEKIKKNIVFLWLIPSTLFIPLLILTSYYIRFGIPEPTLHTQLLNDALYFLAPGFLSGIALVYAMQRSENKITTFSIILGFLFALPVGLTMPLIDGLAFLPYPKIMSSLIASIPISIGILIAYYIASECTKKNTDN